MTNELKAALWGALFAFLGVFIASTLPVVYEFIGWLNDGAEGVMPDLSVVAKAGLAAAAAALTFLVNYAVRWFQAKGWLKGEGPSYAAVASGD